jgi:peptide/nickel transport system substrate-binding protein
VNKDLVSIEFGANPRVVVLAKKVKNYAPTAEGLRGGFADAYLQN